MELERILIQVFGILLLSWRLHTAIIPTSEDASAQEEMTTKMPTPTEFIPNLIKAGVKTRVTQRAFDDVSKTVLDMMTAYLKPGFEIPDHTQELARMGTVTFSNMVLTEFPRPVMNTIMYPGTGIKYELSNVSPKVTGNYSITISLFFYTVTNKGTFTASADDMFASFMLQAARWTQEQPALNLFRCTTGGSIHTNFEGQASDMLDVAMAIQVPRIKMLLKRGLCDGIKSALNGEVAERTREMQIPYPILPSVCMDYGYAAPPMFLDNAVENYHNGQFFAVNAMNETIPSPYTAPDMPVLSDFDNQHVYLFLSEYSANTLLYAAVESGFFNQRISKERFPSEQRQFFATTCEDGCIGAFLPDLAANFPNSHVVLSVQPESAPEVTFANDTVGVSISLLIAISVEGVGNQVTPYTRQQVDCSIAMAGELRDHRFFFNVKDMQIALIADEFNDKAESMWEELGFGHDMLVAKLNAIGEVGIPLPDVSGLKINSKLMTDTRIPNVVILATNFDLMHDELIALIGI